MPASDACPLCSGPLVAPRPVEVCAGCAGSVAATGAVQMASTAEFAAVPMPLEGGEVVAPPSPPRATAAACTWCGKPRAKVKKLLSGGGASICDGCVALCADVLEAELGDGWRG